MIEHHDTVANKASNYLQPAPPTSEYMVEIVNGNFVTGGEDDRGNPICRTLYLSGTNKYAILVIEFASFYLSLCKI